jgi:hypothetical protein
MFEHFSKMCAGNSNRTRLAGTFHEDQYTFFILYRSILRMRNVLGKNVEKIKTHIRCSRGSALVEALRYKPEGRGIDYRWCHWNVSLT